MKTIRVSDGVIRMVLARGECNAKYCPGNTAAVSLQKGDMVTLECEGINPKVVVEVSAKSVDSNAIMVLYKKATGLA